MQKINYRCGELKDMALASLEGKWGQASIVGLLVLVLSSPSSVISIYELINNPQSTSFSAGDVISWLYTVFFLWVFQYGVYIYFLRLSRGEDVRVGNLFDGFKRYGAVLSTLVLQCLYIFLWTLLLFVPGIIKCLSYSMTYYVMQDKGLARNAAIEESMRLMKGNKWKLFVLYLSFIGWSNLAIFTMGIGLIWLTPYINTTMAKFYEALKEQDAAELAVA